MWVITIASLVIVIPFLRHLLEIIFAEISILLFNHLSLILLVCIFLSSIGILCDLQSHYKLVGFYEYLHSLLQYFNLPRCIRRSPRASLYPSSKNLKCYYLLLLTFSFPSTFQLPAVYAGNATIPLTECEFSKANACITSPENYPELGKTQHQNGYCLAIGSATIPIKTGMPLPPQYFPSSPKTAYEDYELKTKFSEWSVKNQESFKSYCPILYEEAIVKNKQEYLCCTERQFGELEKQISCISSTCAVMSIDLKSPWCDFACNPNQSRFVKVKQIRTVESFLKTSPESEPVTLSNTTKEDYEAPYLIESIDLFVSSDMQRDLYDYTRLDTIPSMMCPKATCHDGIQYLDNFGKYALNAIGSPLGIKFKTMENMTESENSKLICPCAQDNQNASCIQPLNSRMKTCVNACGTKCDASDENRSYTDACYGDGKKVSMVSGNGTEQNSENPWTRLQNYMAKNTSGQLSYWFCVLAVLLLLFILAGIILVSYRLRQECNKIEYTSVILTKTPVSRSLTALPEHRIMQDFVEEECSSIDTFVRNLLRKYGRFLTSGNNCILVCCCMLSVAVFLCVGLSNMQTEADPVELWSSKSSTAYKNEKRFNQLFSPFYRTEQIILAAKDGGEIIQPEYLEDALRIQTDVANIGHPNYKSILDKIQAIIGSSDGSAALRVLAFKKELLSSLNPQEYIENNLPSLKSSLGSVPAEVNALLNSLKSKEPILQDICWKATGGACTVQSVTQYYQNDMETFLQYKKMNLSLTHLEHCLVSPAAADYATCDVYRAASVNPLSDDCSCFSSFGAPMNMYNTFLGSYPADADNNPSLYMKSKAMVITILVLNTEDAEHQTKAQTWERRFVEMMKKETVSNRFFDITFMSGVSIGDEIERESKGNVMTVTLSYFLMLLYVTLCLGRWSSSLKDFWVQAKFSVGFFGVATILLSVASTIGLFSWFGIKTQLIIMEVVPFLTLAIGVDNVFLIVHAIERSEDIILASGLSRDNLFITEVISHALGTVGPSILMASLIEATVFLFGCTSTMPAVLWFSLFSSMALLINLCFQFTLFLSIIVLDKRRQLSGRYDIFCFLRSAQWRDANDVEETTDSHDTMTSGSEEINHTQESSSSSNWSDRMIDKYFRFLCQPKVKCAALCILLCSTILSILSIRSVGHGLRQDEAMPHDSYMVPYFKSIEKYLATGPPIYFVVESGYKSNPSSFDFSNNQFTSQLCDSNDRCSPTSIPSILDNLGNGGYSDISRISPGPVYSWLDLYSQFIDPVQSPKCCIVDEKLKFLPPSTGNSTWNKWREEHGKKCFSETKNVIGTKEFLPSLEMFAVANAGVDCMAGGGSILRGQLSINNQPLDYDKMVQDGVYLKKTDQKTKLSAFSYRVFSNPCTTQDDWIETYRQSMRAAEYMTEKTGLNVWAYSMFFVFFDQYLTITFDTYFIIGSVLLAIFIFHAIYFSKFIIPLILTFMIMNICVVLTGIMPVIGILLNGLSFVNLIIAAGISVEFCSHFTRAFLMAGETKSGDERMGYALKKVTSSIIFGITVTKIIGLSILNLSDSRIFIKYYFGMYMGIVIVGLVHGLVFLPVILSYYVDFILLPTEQLSKLKGKNEKPAEVYHLEETPTIASTKPEEESLEKN